MISLFPAKTASPLASGVLRLGYAWALGLGGTAVLFLAHLLFHPASIGFHPWVEIAVIAALWWGIGPWRRSLVAAVARGWAVFLPIIKRKRRYGSNHGGELPNSTNELPVSPRRRGGGLPAPTVERGKPRRRVEGYFSFFVKIGFGMALVAAVLSFLLLTGESPHGKWDAWTIWNLHARFIFRGGVEWHSYITQELAWSHPDYPLLLPLAVARAWTYAGGETAAAPALLAGIFTLATVAVVVAVLRRLQNATTGYVGGLFLLGAPFFIAQGATQTADVPLAFFFLLAAVALVFSLRESAGRGMVLAGMVSALALSVKNEGWPFFLAVLAALLLFSCPRTGFRIAMKNVGLFLTGALPFLLPSFVFSFFLTPPAGVLAAPERLGGYLTDASRYWQICSHLARETFLFTSGAKESVICGGVALLLLFLALQGRNLCRIKRILAERREFLLPAVLSIMMLACYFGVYVVTASDLTWHLRTSSIRLLLHLYPLLVVTVCLLCPFREPEAPGEKDRLPRREKKDAP